MFNTTKKKQQRLNRNKESYESFENALKTKEILMVLRSMGVVGGNLLVDDFSVPKYPHRNCIN